MAWQGVKEFDNLDYYLPSELNRVNENLIYVSNSLIANNIIITLPYPAIKTDYSRVNLPYVGDINKTRANLKAIVQGLYPVNAPDMTPNSLMQQGFSYIEANALEMNLSELYEAISMIAQIFHYSGTFYSGQDIIL